MSTFPNLTGQDDVYPDSYVGVVPTTAVQSAEITVILDSSPNALARAFGLLCTFSLIPASARAVRADDKIIALSLEFQNTEANQLGLLRRKLSQLTEAVEVNISKLHYRGEA